MNFFSSRVADYSYFSRVRKCNFFLSRKMKCSVYYIISVILGYLRWLVCLKKASHQNISHIVLSRSA